MQSTKARKRERKKYSAVFPPGEHFHQTNQGSKKNMMTKSPSESGSRKETEISYDPSDSENAPKLLDAYLLPGISTTPKRKLLSATDRRHRTAAWKKRHEPEAGAPISDNEPSDPLSLALDPTLTDADRLSKLPRPSEIVQETDRPYAHDIGLTPAERDAYARLVRATTMRVENYTRTGSVAPINQLMRADSGLQRYSAFLTPPLEDRTLVLKAVPKQLLSHYYRGNGLARHWVRRRKARRGDSAAANRAAHYQPPSDYIADFDYWCPTATYEEAEQSRVAGRQKQARRAALAKVASSSDAKRKPLNPTDPVSSQWSISKAALDLLKESGSSSDSQEEQSDDSAQTRQRKQKRRRINTDEQPKDKEKSQDQQVEQAQKKSQVAILPVDSEEENDNHTSKKPPPSPPPSPKPLFEKLMIMLQTTPHTVINLPTVKQEKKESKDSKVASQVKEETVTVKEEVTTDELPAPEEKRNRKKRKGAQVIVDESMLTGFERERYHAMMFCQAPMALRQPCLVPVRSLGRAMGYGIRGTQASVPSNNLRT